MHRDFAEKRIIELEKIFTLMSKKPLGSVSFKNNGILGAKLKGGDYQ